MYILGNDASATSLCVSINKIFDIQGFIVINNGESKLITENSTETFNHRDSNKYILATNDIHKRKEFISYFTALEEDLYSIFPNIFFNESYISDIATIGYGNIFSTFSGLFGNASIGNFNYFSPYASSQFNSAIGDNNILYPYSSISNSSSMLSNNILQSNAVINPNIKIGSDNLIYSGECLFENMENREVFQSGIITKNDNYT